MQGIKLSSLQDRIKRGSIPEFAIDRTNPARPKIISEVADREFAARRSEVAEQTDAMKRGPLASKPQPTPPPAAPSADELIDEMFEPSGTTGTPSTKTALDRKRPAMDKVEVITKMIDGKEVPVEKIPYAGEDNFDRYRKAKASTEEMKAYKLELELDELQGRLVDVKEAKAEVEKICRTIREAMLNMPAKASPELFSCADVVELETKLYAEVNAALESLSQVLDARAGA